jgi:uncharacterized protein (TIGR02996 family)
MRNRAAVVAIRLAVAELGRSAAKAGSLVYQEGILNLIAENPHDEAAHLVSADWLEENGDNRAACLRAWLDLLAVPYDEATFPGLAISSRTVSTTAPSRRARLAACDVRRRRARRLIAMI